MLGLAPGSELSKRGDAPAAICVLQNGSELAVDELPMQRVIRGEAVTNQIIDIFRPDSQVIKVLAMHRRYITKKEFHAGLLALFWISQSSNGLKNLYRRVKLSFGCSSSRLPSALRCLTVK